MAVYHPKGRGLNQQHFGTTAVRICTASWLACILLTYMHLHSNVHCSAPQKLDNTKRAPYVQSVWMEQAVRTSWAVPCHLVRYVYNSVNPYGSASRKLDHSDISSIFIHRVYRPVHLPNVRTVQVPQAVCTKRGSVLAPRTIGVQFQKCTGQ